MSMILNEEQTQLKDNASRFFREKSPITALRKLRDDKSELGYDAALWKEIVELGWLSILIPEEYDGLGLSPSYLGPILEESGRTLAATPLFSTGLVGVTALNLAATEDQKKSLFPEIAGGTLLMALAVDETARHNPSTVTTTAKATDGGFSLSGKKVFVVDGHVANYFIVSARTSGNDSDKKGISLFLVDASTPGIEVTRTLMSDSRNSAIVNFNNVTIAKSALLGAADEGFSVLDQLLDVARIGLAAEMLGTTLEAFERTIDYLKERKQFDALIGSFQALQHRAATMFCEIELSKSLILEGLDVSSTSPTSLNLFASMAKMQIGDTLKLVSNEGVQIHGGIGMTDEHEIGFFLKRARVTELLYGDSSFHKDRYALLNDY
ncbi:MAG: acyl-CoA dehydrogenase [Pseudomonadales bacterium]|nr:acyl-CoA dehydrogenase [Pseudomonadales bacterium]